MKNKSFIFAKKIKLKTKLIFAFLILSILPFLLISYLLLNFFSRDIRQQTFNQLVSVRKIKQNQILEYFENVKKQTLSFTRIALTFEAMSTLNVGFVQWGESLKEAEEQAQKVFVVGSENQWKEGMKEKGPYGDMHNDLIDSGSLGYHDYFSNFIRTNNDFIDMFMVNEEGSIVYSFKKNDHFGTNLNYGKYAESSLGQVFQKTIQYVLTDEFYDMDVAKKAAVFYFADFEWDTGSQRVVSYISTPVLFGDVVQGVAIYQLSADKINLIMGERSGLGKTGETYLVGSDQLMRSNSFLDPEKHSVQSSLLDPKKGSANSVTIEEALKGQSGEQLVHSYLNHESLSAYTFIDVFGARWVLLVEMSIAEANEGIQTLRNLVFLIALVSMIIIAFIAYILAKSISSPLEKITARLKDIAEGEGDLTQRITVQSRDELGDLSHFFNRFVGIIQSLIIEIHDNAEKLASSAEELSASTTQMKQNSKEISSAIAQEASATHQSSTAISTSVHSLESIFQSIKDIQSMANEAEEVASYGNEVVGKTNETLSNIEVNTHKIGGVIAVITGIANQTNLLALNAAIEAAKAGENGKGFAVVADEIRVLAEKSRESVVEIQGLINSADSSVAEGVQVIQEMKSLLAQFITKVSSISENLNQLSTVITEQEEGIREVSRGVQVISELSHHNEEEVHELSRTLDETAKTTFDLSGIADDLSKKVNTFKIF